MRIKRKALIFNKMITDLISCKYDEIDASIDGMRSAIIMNGFYSTGPVVYRILEANKENDNIMVEIKIPINASVEMEENDEFSFDKQWGFEDGLFLRHADMEEDVTESYEELKRYSRENNIELIEPFYNIYLEVYGGAIIDIYAPIVKEVSNG